MSTPSSAPVPSSRQLVALVALVAVVLATAVALYALTPASARPDLWSHLADVGPGVGATVSAVLAWLGIRKVRAEHGEQLAQITENTNGALTKRITDVVNDALDSRGFTVPSHDQHRAHPRGDT